MAMHARWKEHRSPVSASIEETSNISITLTLISATNTETSKRLTESLSNTTESLISTTAVPATNKQTRK